MTKIAFILLCHRDPDRIIAQAERLTAAGDCMAIHFDARASDQEYAKIRAALKDKPAVTFARQRVRCGWGEWSLVQATLNAIEAALESFPDATHFYLLSGDCMVIKTAEYAHDFLGRVDADYIESCDFFTSGWIKTGLKEDRLNYRHYLNERKHKRLFYWALKMQRWLRLKRKIPEDLQVQIGSQWWCLRRRTIEEILQFLRERPDVLRFFRTTWIPDETFFQTLVRHLIPTDQIQSRSLTFLLFTDYGMPVTFYNDHFDLLLGQDYLFARKISPDATELKARLGQLYTAKGVTFPISNEGRQLFEFLTGRGRVGRRFAPRFWETETSLGRERELMIVTSKKWHVAKGVVERMRQVTGLPAVDYLFNEEKTPLPDLGGLEITLEKRTRHRRALVRMLFDYYQTDKLIICMDTANLDLMQDFYADQATTRVLEIQCELSEAYLVGHARRIGLAGDNTPPDVLERLLPTIRQDVSFESDRIRDAGFTGFHRLRERASVAENSVSLAAFLGVSEDQAHQIAATPNLFAD
ncbi:glycosyl transferase [Defluviimonas sp. 20V17]|uniref:Peptide O-xylosyltransferase n=1 Tax=Allgaiera indica TaxID=765699 RepID=A0AAN5A193_9RHOB|nr:DUF5928 domain-containing protein [Allgaiera indica]KDB04449.1 glycosyl transferase [Defluviimonas sp. 20V17]GHE05149.1 glycosyl transferase [Allgaiera indica]SDX65814.1 Core-2/I-Branching enzyme [Allgaiera indica]